MSNDTLASSKINEILEEMRDIFLDNIFNKVIVTKPTVRFGQMNRSDHIQFCDAVTKSNNFIADELVIDLSIADDRYAVATTLLLGLVMLYAKENSIQIASRAGMTPESEFYTGRYRNGRFRNIAERYGLVVIKTKNNGRFPIGVNDEVKLLMEQYRWDFPSVREKYLYGADGGNNSCHNKKCVCPNCGKIIIYETKDQLLYCGACQNEIGRKIFGEAWKLMLAAEDSFRIVRADDIKKQCGAEAA